MSKKVPSSQKVEVDIHCLLCLGVGIGDKTEAALSNAFFFGNLCPALVFCFCGVALYEEKA